MNSSLKNSVLTIALFNVICLTSYAQNSTPVANANYGYRIHTSYFGTFLSLPVVGLKDVVNTGIGLKYGSIFNFSQYGFANGAMNAGIKAEWINAEFNFPDKSKTYNENVFSYAFAQNYGPFISFNPSEALYIDVFYMPGWGFRMFGNIDTYETDEIDSSVPHIRFSQSFGVTLRYYGFYTGVNIQKLANPDYSNGVFLTSTNSVQITIGLCGWKVE